MRIILINIVANLFWNQTLATQVAAPDQMSPRVQRQLEKLLTLSGWAVVTALFFTVYAYSWRFV